MHGWLALVGLVLIPDQAFWDLGLYRYWMWLGINDGQWPVLSGSWVYPAGAIVPMLVAALGGTGGDSAYPQAWAAMITVLDAVAVAFLLRAEKRCVAREVLHEGRVDLWLEDRPWRLCVTGDCHKVRTVKDSFYAFNAEQTNREWGHECGADVQELCAALAHDFDAWYKLETLFIGSLFCLDEHGPL